jgi:YD repeat-containing protein
LQEKLMSMSRRALFAKALLAGLISEWLRTKEAAAQTAETAQYTYDAQGRLTRVVYANGVTIDYAYDTAGNRTQVVRAGGSPPPPPPPPPGGFSATIDLTSTSSGANLRSLADSAGYNGAQNATVAFEVENGVIVAGAAGSPNGGIGIDSGVWPTGSHTITLTLTVKSGGVVRGGGGQGGDGGSGAPGSVGGPGGDALYCRLPMTVNVNAGGEVKGGGAGGRGGDGFDPDPLNFGDPTDGGGAAGGGQPNGPGGAGGVGNTEGGGGLDGANGGVGTTSGGGAGGAGGGSAAPGASGASYAASQSGVLGGYAVRKNGHTVTVNNSGTIIGTVG